jgi:nucleotide-binding universal stress UspA family protein
MRILIGIDVTESEERPPVLALLDRLDLPANHPTLIHAVTPVLTEGWHLSPLLGAAEAERRERRAVIQAERHLEALDPEAAHRVIVGKPAAVLLEEANRSDAALVAVNASNRGTLETLFTGSVARAIASAAPQSVLLARPSEKTGPLHAVLATDHSDYATQCLEVFTRLAPRGVEKLTVLTAFPESYADDITEAALGAATQEWEHRCHAIAGQLHGRIGTSETVFESRVIAGRARKVLTDFMTESGADLLILGAKGYSLIERLALGSVSFEQAVGGHPWSTLILRV